MPETPLVAMHKCGLVLVRCMDFRQTHEGAIRKFVAERFPDQLCDLLSLAGIVMMITEPKNARPILASIKLGLEKHGARTVVLVDHTDCGYRKQKRQRAGKKPFKSITKEKAAVANDLCRARRVILKKFRSSYPGIKVLMYLAVLSSDDDTIDFRLIEPPK